MPKTYKISEEEAVAIRAKMKGTKNRVIYNRLEVVALRGEGKCNEEIAQIKKYHKVYVANLVSVYKNWGLEYLAEDHRKGGNHRNISKEKEQKFLKQFEEKAEKGQIITISEIAKEYDELVGKEHKSKSTIYGLLHRHKWRKVMPRSKHPNKASEEEMEASKKN